MFANDSPSADPAIERMVALLREEGPRLLASGHNWKFTFNGSAGGDITAAIELHPKLVIKGQIIVHHN